MTVRKVEQTGQGTVDRGPVVAQAPVGIRTGYQPALDGVRAVAVGIVILFHLGAGGLRVVNGGWLGVDMFFVLSGYLITSLLLEEHRRKGRIDLKRFYVRRFLRLAPLSMVLVLLLWVGQLTGVNSYFGFDLEAPGGLSILFYYSNWWAIADPGSLGSLGHAWSLSIEEQFYLIWPWVVVGVFFVARHAARAVLLVLTTLAVTAIGLARRYLWIQWTPPGTTGDEHIVVWGEFFRNSFLRGDGILYGCLLALVLHRVPATRLLVRVITVLGLAAVVVTILVVKSSHFRMWQPWVPFIPRWGLTTFNVAVAVIIGWLVLVPRSPVARVLSLRPLTWVGRRAYGIYLLHPLMLDVFTRRTSWRRFPLEIAVIGATLLGAGLSFRFLETPFLRLKERFSSH